MDEEVNKLARGLVREEMRHLGRDEVPERYGLLIKALRRDTLGLLQSGVTNRTLGRLDAVVQEATASAFTSFGTSVRPRKLTGLPAKMPTRESFFWAPMETLYESNKGEALLDDQGVEIFNGFADPVIQLWRSNGQVWRDKVVLDLIYQRLTVSGHALYRMIDREVTGSRPLAHLADTMDEWLPYLNVLMIMAPKVGIIPYGDGALLLKGYMYMSGVFNEKFDAALDRCRVSVTTQGVKMAPLTGHAPTDVVFNGETSRRDLRITTYLHDVHLTSDRLWVKSELKRLRELYPAEFMEMSRLNDGRTFTDVDRWGRARPNFTKDLMALLNSKRYLSTCY